MVTESDAKAFQILYEKETGEKISLEEAFECAENLVAMLKIIYKPIKRKDSDQCTRGASCI